MNALLMNALTQSYAGLIEKAKTYPDDFSPTVQLVHKLASALTTLTQQQKALLTLGDQLADWINLAGPALRDMLDAYERRIRSLCTPEQLEKRPWECWEFIKASRVLDAKPVAVVDLALPLANGGASAVAGGTQALIERLRACAVYTIPLSAARLMDEAAEEIIRLDRALH